MTVSVGVSTRWCTGVVFMQPGVKVNGAYYCDVLLLKQLLPDICQAAGEVSSALTVGKRTELETLYFTKHVKQTRPHKSCRLGQHDMDRLRH